MILKILKSRKWLIAAVSVIALIFCVFIGNSIFNEIKSEKIAKNSNRYNISHYSVSVLKNNSRKIGNFDFSNTHLLDWNIVQAASKADNLPVIGEISVPNLEVHLPIFLGVSDSTIAVGAGTMKPGQKMGERNFALASHNLIDNAPKLLFSPITHIKPGMKVYLTDKSKIYKYEITHQETVSANRIDVIDDHSGKNELTLVLCSNEAGVARLIVHGVFERSESYDSAPAQLRKSFLEKYD
ncbi:class A sortase [Lactovum odontotermitis]